MPGTRTRSSGLFLAGLMVAALPVMGVTASEAEVAQRAPASSGSPLPEDALALRPSGTSLGASLARGAEALRSDISRALDEAAAAAASPSAVSAGSDGRLTVLLLGSDYRTAIATRSTRT